MISVQWPRLQLTWQSGPFFQFQSETLLSRELRVKYVGQTLGQLGMDVTVFAGHSFHISAATTAAVAGLKDSLIKTLGRVRPHRHTLMSFKNG